MAKARAKEHDIIRMILIMMIKWLLMIILMTLIMLHFRHLELKCLALICQTTW